MLMDLCGLYLLYHEFAYSQGGSAQTIAQQEVELFIMVVYGRIFCVEENEKNPLTS